MKGVLFGGKGTLSKEVDFELSPESQKELDEIEEQVMEHLRPLYDSLGVDIDTEELHWTNGEVFVVDKKTRKRRDLKQTQQELNNIMLDDAVKLAKEMKMEEKL